MSTCNMFVLFTTAVPSLPHKAKLPDVGEWTGDDHLCFKFSSGFGCREMSECDRISLCK